MTLSVHLKVSLFKKKIGYILIWEISLILRLEDFDFKIGNT